MSSAHAAVVAVFCSVWRPGPVVHRAVSAALGDPAIDKVLVFGYEPTGLALWHKMPLTQYHAALQRWGPTSTPDTLCAAKFKFCGVDSPRRVAWRAKLALDMWACLRAARERHPNAVLVWLENDAILAPGKLSLAIAAAAKAGGAAACYGSSKNYDGDGNLCFVFFPSVDPTGHLLAYHLVQPADWILSDFSRGRWPVVPAVTHGDGTGHASTLVDN